MARVLLEKIEKQFGRVVAVRRLDLEIGDRELVALLGPSGCGKSTVLNIVAGLESPTAGEVYMGERAVTGLEPQERDVAMVFQSYALYPHKKVRDNIAFPLKLRGVTAEERSRRVEDVASRLGVGSLLERRPRELSGGQRQRVALARALIRRPTVFLLDEPLSNLDAQLRTEMRAELKRLHEDFATTTLYVTHDQVEAMTLADRIAVLRDGELQQVGSPGEIYRLPANRFVAGFVGSPGMNLVAGELGTSHVRLQDISLPVDNPQRRQVETLALHSRNVLVGIRPEHLALSPNEKGPGVVYAVEPLGAEALVLFTLGEHRLTARAEPTFDARPGERLSVSVLSNRALLFDPDSGKRLPVDPI